MAPCQCDGYQWTKNYLTSTTLVPQARGAGGEGQCQSGKDLLPQGSGTRFAPAFLGTGSQPTQMKGLQPTWPSLSPSLLLCSKARKMGRSSITFGKCGPTRLSTCPGAGVWILPVRRRRGGLGLDAPWCEQFPGEHNSSARLVLGPSHGGGAGTH